MSEEKKQDVKITVPVTDGEVQEESAEAEEIEESAESAESSETAADDELSVLAGELEASKDRYLRLAAEFENFKKRSAREYAELIESSNDRLMIQLLDVIDNFDRALEITEQKMNEEEGDKGKLFDSLHEGAKMIHQQMADILKSHGVEQIDPQGEEFNPEFHEAVLQIPSDEHPEDTIAQVLAKGYRKNNRVLRHAKVGVSKSTNSDD